ncbi:6-bladed beta-propeller [Muribaculum sp.]|uniref:6-bladed beta-propeller n=1 Tax=Muribaculum sp. TaxID=1918611 RepID=UPI00258EFC84|nr:6-bladed beta-propeller [Muribaculum sp.]MCX4279602.1 6-bladed beta-propeller [Muribaculum sp.]
MDVEDFADVNEFFDDSRFVILETNDSALIGNMSRYDIDDNHIVAYSAESGFAVFDKDGKLLKSFDHRGEGPEEYIQVTGMFLHDGLIYVVSGYQSKILVYSAEDGLFQKRIITVR